MADTGIFLIIAVAVFAILIVVLLLVFMRRGGKEATPKLSMKRKMPLWIDMVNGDVGSFIGKEETADRRFVRVFYVPQNSFRVQVHERVPVGSLVESNRNKDGAVVWTENQYGESPFLDDLKLGLKQNVTNLLSSLEEERNRAASSQIKSRRAITDLQTGLRDVREFQKILEKKGPGEGQEPYVTRNRWGGEYGE